MTRFDTLSRSNLVILLFIIDSLITDAPKKLKITVRATDADYQKMNDIIERHRKWVIDKVGWACGDFRLLLTNE